jgi:hypothetical protein
MLAWRDFSPVEASNAHGLFYSLLNLKQMEDKQRLCCQCTLRCDSLRKLTRPFAFKIKNKNKEDKHKLDMNNEARKPENSHK